jgi:hypothetical protein
MRKIDPLTAIFGLFIILFLLYVNSQNINNVISITFIVLFAFAFFSITTINSMVLKVAIFIILFFSIVAVTSFFYSSGSIYPDYGTNVLLPQLDLATNTGTTIKTINIPVSRKPSSPVYTYSFSTFIKEASKNVSDPNKKYLFYRNASNSNAKNIGLRLGLDSQYNYLYLDYTTNNMQITSTQQTIQITEKFPMNKWTPITITVENNVINIYIDGIKLSKSIKIDNLSAPDSKSEIAFGNMPAYLANFSHSPSIIEPTPSYIQYITSYE